ncbi:protein kinase domain protein [Toxoplasma gondii VEG]|uniref:non-specific serine/threonine protein kinase n=1 Tax=Toxoplasma gondii (strain ATCC 50861 / VEG) TaxID=432359 RepID=V4YT41_TOXGV|nr:protein kinase domain protein [Toxoplasma gondii VEG]CEL73306.1 TPA: PIK3R4 kinase-related protein (incomplete catalytic triad) [Toxoplasma gondii VEG]
MGASDSKAGPSFPLLPSPDFNPHGLPLAVIRCDPARSLPPRPAASPVVSFPLSCSPTARPSDSSRSPPGPHCGEEESVFKWKKENTDDSFYVYHLSDADAEKLLRRHEASWPLVLLYVPNIPEERQAGREGSLALTSHRRANNHQRDVRGHTASNKAEKEEADESRGEATVSTRGRNESDALFGRCQEGRQVGSAARKRDQERELETRRKHGDVPVVTEADPGRPLRLHLRARLRCPRSQTVSDPFVISQLRLSSSSSFTSTSCTSSSPAFPFSSGSRSSTSASSSFSGCASFSCSSSSSSTSCSSSCPLSEPASSFASPRSAPGETASVRVYPLQSSPLRETEGAVSAPAKLLPACAHSTRVSGAGKTVTAEKNFVQNEVLDGGHSKRRNEPPDSVSCSSSEEQFRTGAGWRGHSSCPSRCREKETDPLSSQASCVSLCVEKETLKALGGWPGCRAFLVSLAALLEELRCSLAFFSSLCLPRRRKSPSNLRPNEKESQRSRGETSESVSGSPFGHSSSSAFFFCSPSSSSSSTSFFSPCSPSSSTFSSACSREIKCGDPSDASRGPRVSSGEAGGGALFLSLLSWVADLLLTDLAILRSPPATQVEKQSAEETDEDVEEGEETNVEDAFDFRGEDREGNEGFSVAHLLVVLLLTLMVQRSPRHLSLLFFESWLHRLRRDPSNWRAAALLPLLLTTSETFLEALLAGTRARVFPFLGAQLAAVHKLRRTLSPRLCAPASAARTSLRRVGETPSASPHQVGKRGEEQSNTRANIHDGDGEDNPGTETPFSDLYRLWATERAVIAALDILCCYISYRYVSALEVLSVLPGRSLSSSSLASSGPRSPPVCGASPTRTSEPRTFGHCLLHEGHKPQSRGGSESPRTRELGDTLGLLEAVKQALPIALAVELLQTDPQLHAEIPEAGAEAGEETRGDSGGTTLEGTEAEGIPERDLEQGTAVRNEQNKTGRCSCEEAKGGRRVSVSASVTVSLRQVVFPVCLFLRRATRLQNKATVHAQGQEGFLEKENVLLPTVWTAEVASQITHVLLPFPALSRTPPSSSRSSPPVRPGLHSSLVTSRSPSGPLGPLSAPGVPTAPLSSAEALRSPQPAARPRRVSPDCRPGAGEREAGPERSHALCGSLLTSGVKHQSRALRGLDTEMKRCVWRWVSLHIQLRAVFSQPAVASLRLQRLVKFTAKETERQKNASDFEGRGTNRRAEHLERFEAGDAVCDERGRQGGWEGTRGKRLGDGVTKESSQDADDDDGRCDAFLITVRSELRRHLKTMRRGQWCRRGPSGCSPAPSSFESRRWPSNFSSSGDVREAKGCASQSPDASAAEQGETRGHTAREGDCRDADVLLFHLSSLAHLLHLTSQYLQLCGESPHTAASIVRLLGPSFASISDLLFGCSPSLSFFSRPASSCSSSSCSSSSLCSSSCIPSSCSPCCSPSESLCLSSPSVADASSSFPLPFPRRGAGEGHPAGGTCCRRFSFLPVSCLLLASFFSLLSRLLRALSSSPCYVFLAFRLLRLFDLLPVSPSPRSPNCRGPSAFVSSSASRRSHSRRKKETVRSLLSPVASARRRGAVSPQLPPGARNLKPQRGPANGVGARTREGSEGRSQEEREKERTGERGEGREGRRAVGEFVNAENEGNDARRFCNWGIGTEGQQRHEGFDSKLCGLSSSREQLENEMSGVSLELGEEGDRKREELRGGREHEIQGGPKKDALASLISLLLQPSLVRLSLPFDESRRTDSQFPSSSPSSSTRSCPEPPLGLLSPRLRASPPGRAPRCFLAGLSRAQGASIEFVAALTAWLAAACDRKNGHGQFVLDSAREGDGDAEREPQKPPGTERQQAPVRAASSASETPNLSLRDACRDAGRAAFLRRRESLRGKSERRAETGTETPWSSPSPDGGDMDFEEHAKRQDPNADETGSESRKGSTEETDDEEFSEESGTEAHGVEEADDLGDKRSLRCLGSERRSFWSPSVDRDQAYLRDCATPALVAWLGFFFSPPSGVLHRLLPVLHACLLASFSRPLRPQKEEETRRRARAAFPLSDASGNASVQGNVPSPSLSSPRVALSADSRSSLSCEAGQSPSPPSPAHASKSLSSLSSPRSSPPLSLSPPSSRASQELLGMSPPSVCTSQLGAGSNRRPDALPLPPEGSAACFTAFVREGETFPNSSAMAETQTSDLTGAGTYHLRRQSSGREHERNLDDLEAVREEGGEGDRTRELSSASFWCDSRSQDRQTERRLAALLFQLLDAEQGLLSLPHSLVRFSGASLSAFVDLHYFHFLLAYCSPFASNQSLRGLSDKTETCTGDAEAKQKILFLLCEFHLHALVQVAARRSEAAMTRLQQFRVFDFLSVHLLSRSEASPGASTRGPSGMAARPLDVGGGRRRETPGQPRDSEPRSPCLDRRDAERRREEKEWRSNLERSKSVEESGREGEKGGREAAEQRGGRGRHGGDEGDSWRDKGNIAETNLHLSTFGSDGAFSRDEGDGISAPGTEDFLHRKPRQWYSLSEVPGSRSPPEDSSDPSKCSETSSSCSYSSCFSSTSSHSVSSSLDSSSSVVSRSPPSLTLSLSPLSSVSSSASSASCLQRSAGAKSSRLESSASSLCGSRLTSPSSQASPFLSPQHPPADSILPLPPSPSACFSGSAEAPPSRAETPLGAVRSSTVSPLSLLSMARSRRAPETPRRIASWAPATGDPGKAGGSRLGATETSVGDTTRKADHPQEAKGEPRRPKTHRRRGTKDKKERRRDKQKQRDEAADEGEGRQSLSSDARLKAPRRKDQPRKKDKRRLASSSPLLSPRREYGGGLPSGRPVRPFIPPLRLDALPPPASYRDLQQPPSEAGMLSYGPSSRPATGARVSSHLRPSVSSRLGRRTGSRRQAAEAPGEGAPRRAARGGEASLGEGQDERGDQQGGGEAETQGELSERVAEGRRCASLRSTHDLEETGTQSDTEQRPEEEPTGDADGDTDAWRQRSRERRGDSESERGGSQRRGYLDSEKEELPGCGKSEARGFGKAAAQGSTRREPPPRDSREKPVFSKLETARSETSVDAVEPPKRSDTLASPSVSASVYLAGSSLGSASASPVDFLGPTQVAAGLGVSSRRQVRAAGDRERTRPGKAAQGFDEALPLDASSSCPSEYAPQSPVSESPVVARDSEMAPPSSFSRHMCGVPKAPAVTMHESSLPKVYPPQLWSFMKRPASASPSFSSSFPPSFALSALSMNYQNAGGVFSPRCVRRFAGASDAFASSTHARPCRRRRLFSDCLSLVRDDEDTTASVLCRRPPSVGRERPAEAEEAGWWWRPRRRSEGARHSPGAERVEKETADEGVDKGNHTEGPKERTHRRVGEGKRGEEAALEHDQEVNARKGENGDEEEDAQELAETSHRRSPPLKASTPTFACSVCDATGKTALNTTPPGPAPPPQLSLPTTSPRRCLHVGDTWPMATTCVPNGAEEKEEEIERERQASSGERELHAMFKCGEDPFLSSASAECRPPFPETSRPAGSPPGPPLAFSETSGAPQKSVFATFGLLPRRRQSARQATCNRSPALLPGAAGVRGSCVPLPLASAVSSSASVKLLCSPRSMARGCGPSTHRVFSWQPRAYEKLCLLAALVTPRIHGQQRLEKQETSAPEKDLPSSSHSSSFSSSSASFVASVKDASAGGGKVRDFFLPEAKRQVGSEGEWERGASRPPDAGAESERKAAVKEEQNAERRNFPSTFDMATPTPTLVVWASTQEGKGFHEQEKKAESPSVSLLPPLLFPVAPGLASIASRVAPGLLVVWREAQKLLLPREEKEEIEGRTEEREGETREEKEGHTCERDKRKRVKGERGGGGIWTPRTPRRPCRASSFSCKHPRCGNRFYSRESHECSDASTRPPDLSVFCLSASAFASSLLFGELSLVSSSPSLVSANTDRHRGEAPQAPPGDLEGPSLENLIAGALAAQSEQTLCREAPLHAAAVVLFVSLLIQDKRGLLSDFDGSEGLDALMSPPSSRPYGSLVSQADSVLSVAPPSLTSRREAGSLPVSPSAERCCDKDVDVKGSETGLDGPTRREEDRRGEGARTQGFSCQNERNRGSTEGGRKHERKEEKEEARKEEEQERSNGDETAHFHSARSLLFPSVSPSRSLGSTLCSPGRGTPGGYTLGFAHVLPLLQHHLSFSSSSRQAGILSAMSSERRGQKTDAGERHPRRGREQNMQGEKSTKRRREERRAVCRRSTVRTPLRDAMPSPWSLHCSSDKGRNAREKEEREEREEATRKEFLRLLVCFTQRHLGLPGCRLLKLLHAGLFLHMPATQESKIGTGMYGSVSKCATVFPEIPFVAVKRVSAPIDEKSHLIFSSIFHEVICLDAFRLATPLLSELFDFGLCACDGLLTYTINMKLYGSTLGEWRRGIWAQASSQSWISLLQSSGEPEKDEEPREAEPVDQEESVEFQRALLPLLLGIFRQIACAVATLHARGVLHCDLKCDNVLVDFSTALPVPLQCARRSRSLEEADWSRGQQRDGSKELTAPERSRGALHAQAKVGDEESREDEVGRCVTCDVNTHEFSALFPRLSLSPTQTPRSSRPAPTDEETREASPALAPVRLSSGVLLMPRVALSDFGEACVLTKKSAQPKTRSRGTEVNKSPELLQVTVLQAEDSDECQEEFEEAAKDVETARGEQAAQRFSGEPEASGERPAQKEQPAASSVSRGPLHLLSSPLESSTSCEAFSSSVAAAKQVEDISVSPIVPALGLPSSRRRTGSERNSSLAMAADIWALGCLFFELVTRQFLFFSNPGFYLRLSGRLPLFDDASRELLNAIHPMLLPFLHLLLRREAARRPSASDVVALVDALLLAVVESRTADFRGSRSAEDCRGNCRSKDEGTAVKRSCDLRGDREAKDQSSECLFYLGMKPPLLGDTRHAETETCGREAEATSERETKVMVERSPQQFLREGRCALAEPNASGNLSHPRQQRSLETRDDDVRFSRDRNKQERRKTDRSRCCLGRGRVSTLSSLESRSASDTDHKTQNDAKLEAEDWLTEQDLSCSPLSAVPDFRPTYAAPGRCASLLRVLRDVEIWMLPGGSCPSLSSRSSGGRVSWQTYASSLVPGNCGLVQATQLSRFLSRFAFVVDCRKPPRKGVESQERPCALDSWFASRMALRELRETEEARENLRVNEAREGNMSSRPSWSARFATLPPSVAGWRRVLSFSAFCLSRDGAACREDEREKEETADARGLESEEESRLGGNAGCFSEGEAFSAFLPVFFDFLREAAACGGRVLLIDEEETGQPGECGSEGGLGGREKTKEQKETDEVGVKEETREHISIACAIALVMEGLSLDPFRAANLLSAQCIYTSLTAGTRGILSAFFQERLKPASRPTFFSHAGRWEANVRLPRLHAKEQFEELSSFLRSQVGQPVTGVATLDDMEHGDRRTGATRPGLEKKGGDKQMSRVELNNAFGASSLHSSRSSADTCVSRGFLRTGEKDKEGTRERRGEGRTFEKETERETESSSVASLSCLCGSCVWRLPSRASSDFCVSPTSFSTLAGAVASSGQAFRVSPRLSCCSSDDLGSRDAQATKTRSCLSVSVVGSDARENPGRREDAKTPPGEAGTCGGDICPLRELCGVYTAHVRAAYGLSRLAGISWRLLILFPGSAAACGDEGRVSERRLEKPKHALDVSASLFSLLRRLAGGSRGYLECTYTGFRDATEGPLANAENVVLSRLLCRSTAAASPPQCVSSGCPASRGFDSRECKASMCRKESREREERREVAPLDEQGNERELEATSALASVCDDCEFVQHLQWKYFRCRICRVLSFALGLPSAAGFPAEGRCDTLEAEKNAESEKERTQAWETRSDPGEGEKDEKDASDWGNRHPGFQVLKGRRCSLTKDPRKAKKPRSPVCAVVAFPVYHAEPQGPSTLHACKKIRKPPEKEIRSRGDERAADEKKAEGREKKETEGSEVAAAFEEPKGKWSPFRQGDESDGLTEKLLEPREALAFAASLAETEKQEEPRQSEESVFVCRTKAETRRPYRRQRQETDELGKIERFDKKSDNGRESEWSDSDGSPLARRPVLTKFLLSDFLFRPNFQKGKA